MRREKFFFFPIIFEIIVSITVIMRGRRGVKSDTLHISDINTIKYYNTLVYPHRSNMWAILVVASSAGVGVWDCLITRRR
jgi:hypothetical protein